MVEVAVSPGQAIGRIRVPGVVANLTFGGPKKNRAFICGTTSLYAVDFNGRGSRVPCDERRGHDDPRTGRQ